MRAKAVVNGQEVEVFRPENGGVDQVIFLKEGQSWSYDFLVQLPPLKIGDLPREYRVERKFITDFAGSMFNGDKLTRQVSYVDILVIEINQDGLNALEARYDEQDVCSFQKRLARMSSPVGEFGKLWIVLSFGPLHTMKLLRYIESGKATRP